MQAQTITESIAISQSISHAKLQAESIDRGKRPEDILLHQKRSYEGMWNSLAMKKLHLKKRLCKGAVFSSHVTKPN